MQRIAIIGNAGGGKSLLAQHIGNALRIPVHTVDEVQWRPGWERAESSTLIATLDGWIDETQWVIDGWGPWDALERRFEAADTIVLVDLSIRRHYWWALKRQLECSLRIRRDWPPPGCSTRGITLDLLRLMRRIHQEVRPQLRDLLAQDRYLNRLVHLRTVRELNDFRHAVTLCACARVPGSTRAGGAREQA